MIQRHKTFKIMLFIRTKHNMQIFEVIHFIIIYHYQAIKRHLIKWWKKRCRWRANSLIFFWVSYVQCLEECWHDNDVMTYNGCNVIGVIDIKLKWHRRVTERKSWGEGRECLQVHELIRVSELSHLPEYMYPSMCICMLLVSSHTYAWPQWAAKDQGRI